MCTLRDEGRRETKEVAESEAIRLSRGRIVKAPVNNRKEFRLEPEKSLEPLKNFRQESNTFTCHIYDSSCQMLCGESFL